MAHTLAPVCVYPLHSMRPPGYSIRSRQHPSHLYNLRSIYQQGAPSFLEKGKSPTCQIQIVWNNSHSYLCNYHATRSGVQLHKATFQHHTEHQKPMIGCNKTGVQTVCTNVLYFLNGLCIMIKIGTVFLYVLCLSTGLGKYNNNSNSNNNNNNNNNNNIIRIIILDKLYK